MVLHRPVELARLFGNLPRSHLSMSELAIYRRPTLSYAAKLALARLEHPGWPNPTLTLVANSLYAELESCEVGAASLGNGGSVFPGSDAQQVDGCCGDDMLQVGFGKSAIASAA